MPGNITRVWTADGEVSRDADLDELTRFEVQTDAGDHYVVIHTDTTDGKPSDWEVQRSSDSSPVGQIHAAQSLWGPPSAYRFTKDGATFSGGKQLDLWNAVQSLTD
jgi:hypothetical protein